MKSTPQALRQHMAGDVTTLATLWRITRRDGQVFCFTDHDADIVYNGETYLASTGFIPSAVKTSAGMSVDNMEVQALLGGPSITDAGLMSGVWDYATVKVMRVNYMSPQDGAEIIRTGILGEVRMERGIFTAELRGITQLLRQTIGRVYTPGCDADFCDARCGLNAASYTASGAVTDVISQHAFKDTGRVEADGYYDYGLVTWTSGANAGKSMEVKAYTKPTVYLQQAMQHPIAVGDTYTIRAGCDKTLETCKTRFNNVINYRGFPHVPGVDRLASGT